MRKTVLLLVLVVAALLLASGVALVMPKEQAQAAFPGTNGKIVFERDPDGSQGPLDSEIYTISFDGNNLTSLTNNSTTDSSPAWSADGKRIAFSHSSREGFGYSDIYIMNANGSAKTLVTDERKMPGKEKADDSDPSFSPNGRRLVFVREGYDDYGNYGNYGNIFKIGADGTNPTRIAYGSYRPDSPNWSPDGTKIAYSDRDDPYQTWDYIITMSPDGSNLLYHYNTPGYSTPDWSPDGSQLVIAHYYTGIYKMDANGTEEPTQLTTVEQSDYEPAFSPGGGKIVFSSDRDGDRDLYIMDADGDNVRQLTNQRGDDYSPNWQPVQ